MIQNLTNCRFLIPVQIRIEQNEIEQNDTKLNLSNTMEIAFLIPNIITYGFNRASNSNNDHHDYDNASHKNIFLAIKVNHNMIMCSDGSIIEDEDSSSSMPS